MKAIVVTAFGDESALRCREMSIPEPGENEIRVRVSAAGVNPVETYIRAGQYGSLPALPYTPGNDAAGVVDKIGPGVARLAAGDRVFVAAVGARRNTGSYAEYLVCDADAARPLPAALSFAEGAGLGTPGLAAAGALFSRAQLRPGETVLVHGASGGVGTLAVQLARRAGATVFGTAGDVDGMELVKELGAHRVFNHREDGYQEKIAAAAPKGGVNVVVEMFANLNLARDLSLLAHRGLVVIVGSRGSLEFNPRDAMVNDAAILGMLISNLTREEREGNLSALAAALETGMRVIVHREVPLADAALAHKLVMQREGPGKIVLVTGQ